MSPIDRYHYAALMYYYLSACDFFQGAQWFDAHRWQCYHDNLVEGYLDVFGFVQSFFIRFPYIVTEEEDILELNRWLMLTAYTYLI